MSPIEPGRSQLSYHDDDMTLTSVGRIVGTSTLTIEGRLSDINNDNNHIMTRHNHINSVHSESGGFNFNSSSTVSETKSITSGRMGSRKHPSFKSDRSNVKFRNDVDDDVRMSTRRLRASESSSSDYETDDESSGDDDDDHLRKNSKSKGRHDRGLKQTNMSTMSASQLTPDVVKTFFSDQKKDGNGNSHQLSSNSHSRGGGSFQNNVLIKDDETYDYGDRDDDSQRSLSYEQRRLKEERERNARKAAAAAARAEMEGPFIKTDDVDRYRRTLDTPLSRTAVGVAGAATIGCMLMGPVGLLVGAAAVGIGIGYMQIPAEERQNMNDKASEAVRHAQESAFQASEKLSNSCVTTYRDSGISEHVPPEVQTCCSGIVGGNNGVAGGGGIDSNDRSNPDTKGSRILLENNFDAADARQNAKNLGVSDGYDNAHHGESILKNAIADGRNIIVSPSQTISRARGKQQGKVACLREGPFLSIQALSY